jgi:hypothetical protein
MCSRIIDYSNTMIYKIYCKDTSITDLYVGHTTDFVKRKNAHRYACRNNNSQLKLYTFIREHGGWDNWEMDVIAFFKCRDLCEARSKEQEYFVSLKATLNSIEPFPDTSPRITTNEIPLVDIERHVSMHIQEPENIHNEKTNTQTAKTKNPKSLLCEKCNYTCISKKDFNKHLSTRKHTIDNKNNNINHICCICNKNYKYKSGLCKHKKTCISTQLELLTPNDNIHALTELVKELVSSNYNIIKQNQELQQKVIDLLTKTTVNFS